MLREAVFTVHTNSITSKHPFSYHTSVIFLTDNQGSVAAFFKCLCSEDTGSCERAEGYKADQAEQIYRH